MMYGIFYLCDRRSKEALENAETFILIVIKRCFQNKITPSGCLKKI